MSDMPGLIRFMIEERRLEIMAYNADVDCYGWGVLDPLDDFIDTFMEMLADDYNVPKTQDARAEVKSVLIWNGFDDR